MTWPIQLALALAVFVAGGWLGIEWEQGQQAQLEVLRQRNEQQLLAAVSRRNDKAAKGYERDKAGLRTEFLTITQEVERVVEKPVYRDVCLDDDGVRLVNRAIGAASAAAPGEPARAVPEPAHAAER